MTGSPKQLLIILAVWLTTFASPAFCDQTSSSSAISASKNPYSPESYLAARIYHEIRVETIGSGPARAYIFIPSLPAAKKLPVIFFHHGWLGMNPKNFGGLIDLLVRRGNILIYPVYQDGQETAPQLITALAGKADSAAIRLIDEKYPDLADMDRVFYMGYSMGAAISLNLAIQPQRFGLPAPRAMMLMAPGDAYHVAHGELGKSIIGPVELLPADLPVAIIAGQSDTGIGLPTARLLASRMCHLPQNHHILITLPSSRNGTHRILAGHGSPGAPDARYDFPDSRRAVTASIRWKDNFEQSASLNVLDYYGYWRIATTLADWVGGKKAFPSEMFDARSPVNHFLGSWADGTPYPRATVETPCS